jgi:hypothetical protein
MKKLQQKKDTNSQKNKIEKLHASKGDFKGEVDLIWNPIENVSSYIVQVSKVNGKDSWKQVDIVTKSHCTVTGLHSNRKYKFRTLPVSNSSKYMWSNIVIEEAS